MMETREIRAAILRLSSIEQIPYHYDPAGEVFGDGPIHFLVEVGDQLFVAWGDNETRTIVVNPILRFELHELEELGFEEAWTVVRVPATVTEGIQFREIDNAELSTSYLRMNDEKAAAFAAISR
ncbi:hypothetical protein D0T25_03955 [Duganella sp. BJB488]|uniref:hypothetical protein n=1 Tax=unclassified Duganella TaxID=2636909 RepID=UPI000E351C96|nr:MULTISPECIES: hypothetical protein [unclassified Duganella]RFP24193.1 hypothetical protein D0T26_04000 [Duganella sp. BJB489]RFP26554.1 hypothetical protein D0T25_03955 [Duganella sp. BJB488]